MMTCGLEFTLIISKTRRYQNNPENRPTPKRDCEHEMKTMQNLILHTVIIRI